MTCDRKATPEQIEIAVRRAIYLVGLKLVGGPSSVVDEAWFSLNVERLLYAERAEIEKVATRIRSLPRGSGGQQ